MDINRQEKQKSIEKLIELWQSKHPNAAMGGLWALSGFSFQINAFLLRYFRALTTEDVDPSTFVETERLSDILNYEGNFSIAIQVKRTLNSSALKKTLKEAYNITKLCLQTLPELCQHLRFQILCQQRKTKLSIKNFQMDNVLPEIGGDQETWDIMQGLFLTDAPILEEADPILALYALLWGNGIRDPVTLVRMCQAESLDRLGSADPNEAVKLSYRLAGFFNQALNSIKGDKFKFRLLSLDDIVQDIDSGKDRVIVAPNWPKLDHLKKGYFKKRNSLFNESLFRLSTWIESWENADKNREVREKMPVFWVGGRSGSGKTVLLLQLVAELVQFHLDIPLFQLSSAYELNRFLLQTPKEMPSIMGAAGRFLIAIDDVYNIVNREKWIEEIRGILSVRIPPVALLTSGPTEQQDQFIKDTGGLFSVDMVLVPPEPEVDDFLEWCKELTGERRELSIATRQNPLMMLMMFELARSESIEGFAKRFGERLNHLDVFDLARVIIAINALYLDAPLALIPSENSRDSLEYLCKDEQLHFQVTHPSTGSSEYVGIRLAHAQLAWKLLYNWCKAPVSIEKQIGRALAEALELMGTDYPQQPYAALHQLLVSNLLVDNHANEPIGESACRPHVIKEIYKLHCEKHGGKPALNSLPRWLELIHSIPNLKLVPDPINITLQILSNSSDAKKNTWLSSVLVVVVSRIATYKGC